MAALLGREVLTKDYETVTIRIAFHPVEERFEVSNPAIRKDSAWIPDIATVFDPNVSLTEAHRRAMMQSETRMPIKTASFIWFLERRTQDHQQPCRRDQSRRRPRYRDGDRDLHPGELGRRVAQSSRLRDVQDRGERDAWRQYAAQGYRLLLPPRRRTGILPAHREVGQGICCIRVPSEDAMVEGRERRPLRPHLYGHASGRVHVGVSARQAAGPGRAAVRPQFRDQAIRRRDRRRRVRQVEDWHLQLHEQDALRSADDDHTLGRFRHVEADRQPERRQLRLHPVPPRPGRGDAGRRHRAPRPALVRYVALA